ANTRPRTTRRATSGTARNGAGPCGGVCGLDRTSTDADTREFSLSCRNQAVFRPPRPRRAGNGLATLQRAAFGSRQAGQRCRDGARMLAGVTGTLINLALIVVFVTIGGFFSGSELAVLTLRESQVERLAGRRGERVRRLRLDPSRFLASVQVGVTFAGFFASAYGGATLSEPWGKTLEAWGLPASVASSVAF